MVRWKASSAKAPAPLYDLSSLAAADQTVLRARQVLGMKKLPKYVSFPKQIFQTPELAKL